MLVSFAMVVSFSMLASCSLLVSFQCHFQLGSLFTSRQCQKTRHESSFGDINTLLRPFHCLCSQRNVSLLPVFAFFCSVLLFISFNRDKDSGGFIFEIQYQNYLPNYLQLTNLLHDTTETVPGLPLAFNMNLKYNEMYH